MKVLYLSEWYPHRYDAMAGLFVRKHAEAVARRGVDVCVLYLHRDDSVRGREPVEQVTDGVREVYVYYRGSYLLALRAGWRYVRTHWGMPDLCQLNVITKNALLPLYLRRRYGVPYLIVEHWSGYLPQNGAYERSPWWHRLLASVTVRRAEALLPVSQVLEDNMRRVGLSHPNTLRLHNVVDDFFYDRPPLPRQDTRRRLLHVSCFDEQAKNVTALLRGFRELCKQSADVQIVMVGTGKDITVVKDYAREIGIPKGSILWLGEQTPLQVYHWLCQSNALILTSRYETYAIVLAEAVATGTPVLTTPVGIAMKWESSETAVIISQENANKPSVLSDYMKQVLTMPKYILYNKRFSSDTIGKQLIQIYTQCTDFE